MIFLYLKDLDYGCNMLIMEMKFKSFQAGDLDGSHPTIQEIFDLSPCDLKN